MTDGHFRICRYPIFAGYNASAALSTIMRYVAVVKHCYGNALYVMRTVEKLESVGISTLTIDDPALPFGFGDASWSIKSTGATPSQRAFPTNLG